MGPSLEEISALYKKKVSDNTFFLLAYHVVNCQITQLKLVDRLDNAGFVCRSLSPKNLVFSDNYMKNELYLLNSFEIEKKN